MAGEHDEWLPFDEPAPGLLRQLRGHRPVGASVLVVALIALAVGVVALFRTSANQAAAPATLRSVAPFLGFDPYLAYDAKHQQVVLVNNPGQIWLWANRSWRMAHAATVSSPTGCCGAAAWDPELGRVLLFEAVPPGDAQPLTFTYAWDGASWTQLVSVAEYQPPVGAYSMAYDASQQQMVMLASVGTPSGALEIETWIYQGGRWRRRSNLDSAAFSVISAVGFDARARTLLALSGDSTGTGTRTWRWDGSTWKQLAPSHIPPESAHMTLVNDPGSGRLLLLTQTYGFGKRTVTQTWSWTGSDWIERGPLAVNDLVPYAVTAGNDLWAFQEIPTDSHGVRTVGVFRWNGAGWDQVAVARVSPARSG